MLWKRAQVNRRQVRGSVLQVRLRTRAVRMARLRMVGASLAMAFGMVAALLILWYGGAWALDRFVFSNPSFAVRRLQIRTDGILPAGMLQRWSGVRRDDNLLALNLERIRRDLELVPLIDSVALQRLLPDTLKIEVHERTAVAEVRVPRLRPGGGVELVCYYIDDSATVFTLPAGSPPELSRLLGEKCRTRIEGLNVEELRPGRAIKSESLKAALELILAFEKSPMSGRDALAVINVSREDRFEAVTVEGSQIRFGLQHPYQQLDRWRQAYDYALTQNSTIARLDLSVSNHVPLILEPGRPGSGDSAVHLPTRRQRHV